MGTLSFSAIGTAMIRGPQYKLDLEALDPGVLMSSDRRTGPSAKQVATEAKLPLAQTLREEMLQSMGLRPEDLAKMKPQTRADLEDNLARYVHEHIRNAPGATAGSFVDVRA